MRVDTHGVEISAIPEVELDEPIPEAERVLQGIDLRGRINVDDETLYRHIRHSTRLGYPQVKEQPPNGEHVLLVGSGPSLEDTKDELIRMYFEGAKVFTLNGAYHWCLAHNIRPSAQIVMDARESNARFVLPYTPRCRYLIASQCHPATWEALKGHEDVWIFHASTNDGKCKEVLDECYFGEGHWMPVGGGTTVATRGLGLLRMMGFLRFDLFGIDSCWMGGVHHAMPQPENARDRNIRFTCCPSDRPDLARDFECSPWQAKQLEDFLQLLKDNGQHFLINVHGEGLLAFALNACGDEMVITQKQDAQV